MLMLKGGYARGKWGRSDDDEDRPARCARLRNGGGAACAPRLSLAQTPHRLRFTLIGDPWRLLLCRGGGAGRAVPRGDNPEMPINRGYGSGRVPVDVARVTHDLGRGPHSQLSLHGGEPGLRAGLRGHPVRPLPAFGHREGGWANPGAEAAQRQDAGGPEWTRAQIFPVFASAAGIDLASINWMSVSARAARADAGSRSGRMGSPASSLPPPCR